MTDIDEARNRLRRWARGVEGERDAWGRLAADMHTVLDALDAAERERDEALAVIERAKQVPIHAYADYDMRRILRSVPADVLRERDADRWDEAIRAVQARIGDDGMLDQHRLIRLKNPYRETKEQD